jgi:hypothetical protein
MKNKMDSECGTHGERSLYRVPVRHLRERDHLEELGVDGSIILEWILKKLVVRKCTGLIWLRVGKSGGIS